MATGWARCPGLRFSAPTNLVSTTLPSAFLKSIWTAYEAVRSVLLVMLTSTASRPPSVFALGMPVMDTSDRAFPGPCTFFSSACACALARAVSAETDASNSEAAADSEEAAAEAEARAEPMIDRGGRAGRRRCATERRGVRRSGARGDGGGAVAATVRARRRARRRRSGWPGGPRSRGWPVRAGPPWVRLLMELVLFLPVRNPVCGPPSCSVPGSASAIGANP